jgi:hypothetical protein
MTKSGIHHLNIYIILGCIIRCNLVYLIDIPLIINPFTN